MFLVKYFGLGHYWIYRGRRKSDFSFSLGKKKRKKNDKTHEVLAIDTEFPIVERFTALSIVQKLLVVLWPNAFTVSASRYLLMCMHRS